MNNAKKMQPFLRIIVWIVGIAMLVTAACWVGKDFFCQPVESAVHAPRMGIVDVRVLMQAPKVVERNKQISAEFEPKREQLLKLQERNIQARNDFNKNKTVMSDSVRKQKEAELTQDEQNLKDKSVKFSQDFTKVQATFEAKLGQIIEQIARKNGIDCVLHKEVVLYANSKLDITPKVMDVLKKSDL